jgi:hypothetical protein
MAIKIGQTVSAEDFKKMYPAGAKTSDGELPDWTPPVQTPQPSLLQKLGGFLKGEITGQPEKAGILGDIFQTTLGSKGILGVLQMPGRVAGQAGVLKDQIAVSESQGQLANAIAQMIQRSKTITDPAQKAKIDEMIQGGIAQMQQMGGDVSQLQKAVTTPQEALATSARAALTLAPFAKAGGIGLTTAEAMKSAPTAIRAAEMALGVPQIGGGLAGAGARIGVRAAESGLTSAAFGGATAFGEEKPAKEIARTAASYGITGAVLGATIQTGAEAIGAIREGLMAGASKIQVSRLSPNKADMEDVHAFSKDEAVNVLKKNIEKYGLYGNAQNVAEKSETQLTDLNSQLKEILTGSEKKINLTDIFDKTEEAIKADSADNLKVGLSKIDDAFEAIKGDISEVYGDTAKLDLVKANALKRITGTGGAWEYGRADPDAIAKEKVWNYLYTQIKQSIEQAEPGETTQIQQLNKQMSEIIPIYKMALRRIPPEAKASSLSLKTLIALGFSFTNPKALALVALDIASRSGRLAGILSGVGGVAQKMSTISPTAVVAPSMVLTRIIEKLRGQSGDTTVKDQADREKLNQLIQESSL